MFWKVVGAVLGWGDALAARDDVLAVRAAPLKAGGSGEGGSVENFSLIFEHHYHCLSAALWVCGRGSQRGWARTASQYGEDACGARPFHGRIGVTGLTWIGGTDRKIKRVWLF